MGVRRIFAPPLQFCDAQCHLKIITAAWIEGFGIGDGRTCLIEGGTAETETRFVGLYTQKFGFTACRTIRVKLLLGNIWTETFSGHEVVEGTVGKFFGSLVNTCGTRIGQIIDFISDGSAISYTQPL